MKSISKGSLKSSAQNTSPTMAMMVVFLLCGIIIGCLVGKYISGESDNFLKRYVLQYEEITHVGVGKYSFLKSLFNLTKYPVIIFLLSFTAIGVFSIPLIVFIKGFFSAISVSAVIHSIGTNGILAALSIFGIQTLITFPCILLISSIAFEFSKVFFKIFRRNSCATVVYPISLQGYIFIFFICLIALLLCTLVDMLLTPIFVNLAINVVK